jgi:hypothetical protein
LFILHCLLLQPTNILTNHHQQSSEHDSATKPWQQPWPAIKQKNHRYQRAANQHGDNITHTSFQADHITHRFSINHH